MYGLQINKSEQVGGRGLGPRVGVGVGVGSLYLGIGGARSMSPSVQVWTGPITWGTMPNRQTDRQQWLKTLPSCKIRMWTANFDSNYLCLRWFILSQHNFFFFFFFLLSWHWQNLLNDLMHHSPLYPSVMETDKYFDRVMWSTFSLDTTFEKHCCKLYTVRKEI